MATSQVYRFPPPFFLLRGGDLINFRLAALCVGIWPFPPSHLCPPLLPCLGHLQDCFDLVVQGYVHLVLWGRLSSDFYLAASFTGALISYAIVCQ